MSNVTMPENFMVAHSQSQSPVPTVASTSSDPTMQSSFGIALHPQHWVGPTSVPWDTLGSGMQYSFEADVA